jgi:DNA polymerase (family 10)
MIAPPNIKARRNALSNAELADRLDVQADRIAERDDNPYHVMAYRRAAQTLRELPRPVVEILDQEGRVGLERLPGIGESLAGRIERIVAQADDQPDLPVQQFATIADIGPELARRIHLHLGITTLGELHRAAYDGRLAQVPGIGPKRLRAVRESLAARIGGSRAPGGTRQSAAGSKAPQSPVPAGSPPVEVLLEIDRQYRELAGQDRLPRIAPKRFNPTGEAWLAVLRTQRGAEHYTALYSNTARAHELGTTQDWVVIYRDRPTRDQWTVVTGQFGRLRGRRIVRGREKECAEYYLGGRRPDS